LNKIGLFDNEDFGKTYEQYANQVRMGTGVDIKNISYSDPRFELYNNLQSDAARFTAFREAQRVRELAAVRTDLDKSRIEKRYNEYLKTEKQGIFANSAAAERWTGFQENADLYANLEWRTAGDSDVRTEHAALEGLVLPINDPFWNSHTPPLGFGCRCEVIQTDVEVNKTEGHENTPAPKGFDFNPGIDQQIFSDSAGYYTSAPTADVEILTEQARNFSGNLSRVSIRESVKDTYPVLKPAGLNTEKPIVLSNTDIKTITGKNQDNQVMRNALLFDIVNVVKDAKLVKSAADSENPEVTWYYYAVKGFDNMFLNLVKMKSGVVKLHAITDKIK
jgi:SPP1 gp7 family putative phage head morphogenesis protein